MEFTVGNIITLFIVAIVLVIYRQLDKNNRSLEKIKRYSEKIKDELDSYIESKTVEVKNFAIELDVHQETGKAILNRIAGAEGDLESKAAYIEKMYERINEYDRALNELTQMTGRVQNNLDRLHEESEFVDKVGKRVKEAGLSIVKLEKAIPGLTSEFAKENIKELKVVRSVVLKDTQKVVSRIQDEISVSENRINEFSEMVKSLDNTRESMKKETEESIRRFLDDQIYKTEQAGEHLTAELSDRFDTILARKTEEADGIETGMNAAFEKISESFSSVAEVSKGKIEQFGAEAKLIEDSFENALKDASERGATLKGQAFDSVKNKIDQDADKLRKDFEDTFSEINRSVSHRLEEFGKTYETIAEKSRKDLEKLSADLGTSDIALRDRILGVESRVDEYEENLNYRFTKLESLSMDMDSLEENLRAAMDQTVTRIGADFRDYEKQQNQVQDEYKQKMSEEMTELYEGINNLELELNGLKNRAYENVAKGLKVFEDDFFSDLKTRNIAMEEKLIEWQGGVDKNLEDLARTGDEKREGLEKEYSEKLRSRLEELQERIFANQLKFETQVADFQTRIEERMNQSDSSIISTEESIKKELVEIQESAKTAFSREFIEYNSEVSARLKKSDREIGTRLTDLGENIDQKGKELLGLTANVQSELTLWQAKILQEMKESQTEIKSGYEDLKKDVFNNIAQIQSDCESQKEDLIISTQEERARIRNELKENASGVIQLETDLRNKTEASMENFKREYETFILEIQKRNRDMQIEFDKKIKDFRMISSETKDKTDQLQKKLYGKIEENYKILAVNLQEIDKRQKGFISQTKIFDRADSLKVHLQESIEDLKTELIRVEAQGTEVRETERKFTSIKKLGEDVNSKLSRFLAEKRHIEEMEGDFKKLIIISQSVDTKLSQVTNSHDDLQAIQVKIRNLMELEKEVALKYERLEKKDQIIENTTISVDKNFQLLSDLDDQIRTLNDEVTNIPEKIHDISSKIEVLSRNKSKAEETVKQVKGLDAILKDIENRIKNMQKAREWLAKTETRMEEVFRQAEEQVKLLGTILKDGNKPGSDSKGAPPLGVRDVVTRLAHQGWSIQQIASATKLSRGEVELILELLPKK